MISWALRRKVKWIFESPEQAKTQGKTERAIREAKRMMRKQADENPKGWLKIVPFFQLAFNTRYFYRDTELTPSQLLFGFQPRNPLEICFDLPKVRGTETELKELRKLHLARIDSLRETAVNRQLKGWEWRVINHDSGLRNHKYEVGDWVLFQNYPLKGKHGHFWEYRWKGPVEIVHISQKGKVNHKHLEDNAIMKK